MEIVLDIKNTNNTCANFNFLECCHVVMLNILIAWLELCVYRIHGNQLLHDKPINKLS